MKARPPTLFLRKKAAMQMDGSWLASPFPTSMMDTLAVLPMPLRTGSGGTADCYIGGVSMGFYLTRRAWSPDTGTRRWHCWRADRAESLRRLGNSPFAGRLLNSAEEMQGGQADAQPAAGRHEQKRPGGWLLECIPAVAEGSMTAEECWEKVMALSPFGE